MNDIKLTLGGRLIAVNEPVFKHLKIIISAYNQLSQPIHESEKVAAIDTMVRTLTLQKIKLKQLSPNELADFLKAIPGICRLKTTDVKTETAMDDDPWGEIYAHISACLGWTWDYIDNNMTMSRLDAFKDYWLKHPPTHQLVASYLGYEYQDKKSGNDFLKAIVTKVKGAQHVG